VGRSLQAATAQTVATNEDPARRLPLRISRDRVWLYGATLAIITGLPFVLLGWFREAAYRGDFALWWSAGRNAGTRALINPAQLIAWQSAHHLGTQPFPYPPGFAWFYAPLSHLEPMAFAFVEAGITVALLGVAALMAARTYGFDRWFAIVAVFAWAPSVNAIEVGQSTGLALALVTTLIWALSKDRWALAGLAAGVLMYKPTVAAPLILLLVVRKQWRALAVVAACGLGWYLLSVQASHGDWSWPLDYERMVANWLPVDFRGSALKAFTLPGLLMNVGVGWHVAFWTGVAILLLMLPRVSRAPTLEAASIMPLLGLATSAHAWPYDITLMLPATFFTMVATREPWRTRLVIAAYVLAAVGMAVPYGSRLLAILVLGATGSWLSGRLSSAYERGDAGMIRVADDRTQGRDVPDCQTI
jgi:Glycosyltransferase family 87